jgi:hypothetical protein
VAGQLGRVRPAEREGWPVVGWGWEASGEGLGGRSGLEGVGQVGVRWGIHQRRLRRRGRLPTTGTAVGRGNPSSGHCPQQCGGRWSSPRVEGKDITIDVLWDVIENVASRAELRASVANIRQILPPDTDPDGEWRSALMSRYPLVRKFLRLLVEAIEFGATRDAELVLSALKGLPGLLDAGPTERVPGATWMPAGRDRCGHAGLAGAGVTTWTPGGNGGPGRVRVLRARSVPSAAAPAGYLRRGVLAVGRPASSAALGPGVGIGP